MAKKISNEKQRTVIERFQVSKFGTPSSLSVLGKIGYDIFCVGTEQVMTLMDHFHMLFIEQKMLSLTNQTRIKGKMTPRL